MSNAVRYDASTTSARSYRYDRSGLVNRSRGGLDVEVEPSVDRLVAAPRHSHLGLEVRIHLDREPTVSAEAEGAGEVHPGEALGDDLAVEEVARPELGVSARLDGEVVLGGVAGGQPDDRARALPAR